MNRNPLQRHKGLQRGEKTLKRGKLKKISKARRTAMERYYAVRDEYLKTHVICGICLVLGYDCPNPSSEIHHLRGRNGRLLCDTRFFAPSCRAHREWPHEHPSTARELGLLSSPAEWGVYPV